LIAATAAKNANTDATKTATLTAAEESANTKSELAEKEYKDLVFSRLSEVFTPENLLGNENGSMYKTLIDRLSVTGRQYGNIIDKKTIQTFIDKFNANNSRVNIARNYLNGGTGGTVSFENGKVLIKNATNDAAFALEPGCFLTDPEYNKAVPSETDASIPIENVCTINANTTMVNGNVSESTARAVVTMSNPPWNVTAT